MPQHAERAPERLLRLDEVADRWGVSTRTVQRLIADSQLTAVRVNRALRFHMHDIVNFENSNRS